MPPIPTLIPVVAILATCLGLFAVAGLSWSHCPIKACWSRRLCVAVFLLVAVFCFYAALTWPRGVLPFGLAMATLFLGMLWTQSHTVEDA